jgi:hypothetical protein
MPTYRIVWIDAQGTARKSRQVECLTDREAIEMAEQQIGDYERVEVWDGFRPCRPYRESGQGQKGLAPSIAR